MSFRNCLKSFFVSSSSQRVNRVFFSSVASSQAFIQSHSSATRRTFHRPSSEVHPRPPSPPHEGFGNVESEGGGGSQGGRRRLVVTERLCQHHIMSIGLNRPGVRNAVDSETSRQLVNAFQDFEADDEMYVAILHGFGGNFCAGVDLRDLSNNISVLSGCSKIKRLSKPVIGAINGFAVGGGLELSLLCDLRVMEESAKVGVLGRRFGVPLLDGGTVRLPELIGLSRALDLILTGRTIGSKEALEFGIANRIAQDGNCFGMALKLAQELTKYPQACLRADRSSAYFSACSASNIDEALQYEWDNGVPNISTEEPKKFTEEGLGKHGKYNVNPAVDPEDWQTELQELKEKSGIS